MLYDYFCLSRYIIEDPRNNKTNNYKFSYLQDLKIKWKLL